MIRPEQPESRCPIPIVGELTSIDLVSDIELDSPASKAYRARRSGIRVNPRYSSNETENVIGLILLMKHDHLQVCLPEVEHVRQDQSLMNRQVMIIRSHCIQLR